MEEDYSYVDDVFAASEDVEGAIPEEEALSINEQLNAQYDEQPEPDPAAEATPVEELSLIHI